MRILIVTTRYGEGLGGKENYLVSLGMELMRRGHEVRVATRSDDAFPEFAGSSRFTATRARLARAHAADVRLLAPSGAARLWTWPAWRLHFYPKTFSLAADCFARAFGPALAGHVQWSEVVHYDGTGLELLGQATLRECVKYGKALVVCPHLHAGSWGDSAHDILLYRDAHGLIAKTRFEAGTLRAAGVPEERIAVIGNGPHLPEPGDADKLAGRLGGRGPTVLFVGRRTGSKGYPLVIEAMEQVRAARPDARLLVLAPLDDPDPGGPTGPHVHVLAGASEADKDAAYQLATVLVLPSAAEAFGMAVVEGWSHGVPAVVSTLPTLEEIVTEAGGGRVVPREAPAIAASLLELLDSPELARKLGEAGRATVQRRYRWDLIAERTEALYGAAVERVFPASSALAATLLAGSWRAAPPPLPDSIQALELSRLRQLLLPSGAGALGWWKLRGSTLTEMTAARAFQEAFRLHALESALHEHRLALVLGLLRGTGADPIVLKGWSIARLYPDPALRPYGDIDVLVRPEHLERARAALLDRQLRDVEVDLFGGNVDLADRSLDELYAHSRVVPWTRAPELGVRVLGPEHQLRHLCLHQLRHGLWRPLWLCDVALLIETLPGGFDWELCLSGGRFERDGVVHVIGLAGTLLGARIDALPPASRAEPPRWLIPAVLDRWPHFTSHYYSGTPLAEELGRPAGLWKALRRRWRDPIEATVSLRAPWTFPPRLTIQLLDWMVRTVSFLWRLMSRRAGSADRPRRTSDA